MRHPWRLLNLGSKHIFLNIRMIAANTLNKCTAPFPSASAELRRFINRLIIIISNEDCNEKFEHLKRHLKQGAPTPRVPRCSSTRNNFDEYPLSIRGLSHVNIKIDYKVQYHILIRNFYICWTIIIVFIFSPG